MGYFDEAIENRTLAHSSGPWKKHKYFQKIGEGANAVYRYAKKKADEKIGITAQNEYYDAKKNADYLERRAHWDRKWVDDIKEFEGKKKTDKIQVMKDLSGQMVDGDTLVNVSNEQAKGAKKTAAEKKKVYDKTLFGKIDKAAEDSEKKREKTRKAVEDGLATIKKLLGR